MDDVRQGTPWNRVERVLDSPLAGAVVAGALGAYPVGRAPRRVRRAWVVLPAVAAAGATAVYARVQDPPWRPVPTVAGAVAVGGLTATGQQLSVVVDQALESFVRRRGVRRPRLVLGVVYGLLSGVLSVTSARTQRRAEAADPGRDDGGVPA